MPWERRAPWAGETLVARHGESIAYRLYGNRSAPHKLLFTMGMAGDHTHWEPQIEYFAARPDEFQVCVWDNRGVGNSGDPGGRWTTSEMARDALELLDHLGKSEGGGGGGSGARCARWGGDDAGSGTVHAIGLSMGGMVTQELVLLAPARFLSMTLVSTHAGGLVSMPPFHGVYQLVRLLFSSSKNDALAGGLLTLFPQSFLDAQSSAPAAPGAADAVAAAAAARGVDVGAARGEETNRDRFARVLVNRHARAMQDGCVPLDTRIRGVLQQVPAVVTHYVTYARLGQLKKRAREGLLGLLVVTGDADLLVHPRNSRMLAKALGAPLILFGGAGHGANEQCADQFNARLERLVRDAEQRWQERRGHPRARL